jgi:hypothetical protein
VPKYEWKRNSPTKEFLLMDEHEVAIVFSVTYEWLMTASVGDIRALERRVGRLPREALPKATLEALGR